MVVVVVVSNIKTERLMYCGLDGHKNSAKTNVLNLPVILSTLCPRTIFLHNSEESWIDFTASSMRLQQSTSYVNHVILSSIKQFTETIAFAINRQLPLLVGQLLAFLLLRSLIFIGT